MTNKIAYGAMTPLDKVLMLPLDQVLDRRTVNRVMASGHSRLPVYANNDRRSVLAQYAGDNTPAFWIFIGKKHSNRPIIYKEWTVLHSEQGDCIRAQQAARVCHQ